MKAHVVTNTCSTPYCSYAKQEWRHKPSIWVCLMPRLERTPCPEVSACSVPPRAAQYRTARPRLRTRVVVWTHFVADPCRGSRGFCGFTSFCSQASMRHSRRTTHHCMCINKSLYFEHPHPLWVEILWGSLGLGIPRTLCGWALQDTLELGTPGTLWGWALQA